MMLPSRSPVGSETICNNSGIAAGSPCRASAKASARRTNFWRDFSPYQVFICRTVHAASLSLWHRLHAFGMSCRIVFSGTGTLIEWSRIRAFRLMTVGGMWQSTHQLPELFAA